MSKGTIHGNSGDNSGSVISEIASRQPKSLNKVREEQASAKKAAEIQKKIQKELKKLKLKDEEEIARKRIELETKLEAEKVAETEAKRQKAQQKFAKEQETQELVARAKQRKEEIIARREAREDQIAAAREAALEQISGANTVAEKMKGIGNLLTSGIKGFGEAFKEDIGDSLSEAAENAVKNVAGALSKAVDAYLDVYTRYMTSINARIQGAYADMDYESLEKVIRSNTAGSPFVKYADTLENLNKLVNEGTAVNLTQRAFLATISDKIATTFDATDATLLRLIRLQQNDTTAARLGMEAELTKLFNYYFSDTSYLSQAFDNVTSALTDLSSQLSATNSVEFDYIVQKWLGALGSVGVDSGTLTNLASAINALGTGQVDYLSSNSTAQNLLVLAANRVGLDYGQMLLDGVSSTDVNTLLYGIIDYIQDTVQGANNVVKAQYAQLFGLSVADINAFANISDEVIESLYESGMTYQDTLVSLNQQLSQVGNRMHLSEMINNVLDNVMATTGTTIAGNAGLYGTYKAFDLLESITGGIHIPTITVLGSGITLPDSIEGMAKSAILGIGTIASLVSAISNWTNGGGLNLARWEGTWSKGTYSGFTSMNELQASTSSTGVVSNTNETGMQQSVYDEQKKSAEEITGKEEKGEEDSQMVKLLTRLVEFFENGKSKDVPMTVQFYTPKSLLESGEDMSLPGLLKAIKDRVNSMGTDGDPVYAVGSSLFTTTTDINSWLPGSTI